MARSEKGVAKEDSLTFNSYQLEAVKTDMTGDTVEDSVLVAVLGIMGESGDLATLFKKGLRDGASYTALIDQFKEELGDILWYLSTLCSKLGLSLEEVAQRNLVKTNARWGKFDRNIRPRPPFDAAFPEPERLPRHFKIEFKEAEKGGQTVVELHYNGQKCGDSLTDNSYFDNGYRYHDAFHLAYAAVLGWSPITRKLLGCKRRSKPDVDEIEDGGRASVIEEAIAALVFSYAEKHNLLEGVGIIDSDLLATLRRLTEGLEIHVATAGEWERAILEGFMVFRLLNRNCGGFVQVDQENRRLKYARHSKS